VVAGQSAKSAVGQASQVGQVKKSIAIPLAADGHPDLSGIWDYRTIHPARTTKRPGGEGSDQRRGIGGPREETVQARNQDRRDGAGTDADVARAYNDFWWDFGKKVIKNRTSLVVDPADVESPL